MCGQGHVSCLRDPFPFLARPRIEENHIIEVAAHGVADLPQVPLLGALVDLRRGDHLAQPGAPRLLRGEELKTLFRMVMGCGRRDP